MNTLEECAADCPIVRGLPEERKMELLQKHRQACLDRRLGQLGLLCGMPSPDAQNALTKVVLAIPDRHAALIEV